MLPSSSNKYTGCARGLGRFQAQLPLQNKKYCNRAKPLELILCYYLTEQFCRYWSDKYYFRVMITRENPTTCLIELWWYKFIHIFFCLHRTKQFPLQKSKSVEIEQNLLNYYCAKIKLVARINTVPNCNLN